MARDEFNIDEAEDFDDGTRAVLHAESESDGGAEAQDATRLRSSRKQRLQAERQGGKQREQASALRVKNWDAGVLESAEYAGKVVKRKDLQEDEAVDSPDEDAMAEWSDAEPFGASDDEEEEEEEVEEEESEEDSDDEDKSAETLIRGFQKEDSARLMGAQDSEKVVEKAKHVRHQKLLWERCLEVQIYTKRLLTTAKDAAAHETDGETTEEEVAMKTKQQVVDELYKSIDAVSALQEKLCNVPELTAPSSDSPTKKRKRACDELWQEITTSNRAMLPQYNDILNTYTRKTDLAAGGKNSQAKKFKAVNQDILAQVESVLVDPQRVKRKAHAPLDAPEAEAADGAEDLLDELMYDDSDFYQQLLKEFIESGGGAGQDAMVRRTHRKKKKIVNRKASKGRQLRYTVHPKLENFMFPEPFPKPEMDVDELFRSLFGQVRQ
ncbi:hypothetical protein PF005_g79 [Phytophthora fragariae]|uniref:Apoptosis-antagonizing transcription factor C-terminal domain-containing protein n=1 Tax=Phytophthora fragariae TaxID=53985 RepID=A0A6A4ES78_9STRA|nr:hypothetical protein PF003_g32517 [Phytophthora fragariae]KAE8950381.1 hypothetical protein PF009_g79 [Phytophthora fragariae]KAE9141736.1 hypothetical protein PF007_g16 [Phytophthora fragariae]KAE9156000.1 hypothetical protein PF006_g78 [Phytophthora fragariae]KAE9238712.1 hypothetical protein PF005_g79 [Phytophthora fragariae]